MKKLLTFAILAFISLYLNAKDIKSITLTTEPEMHCEKCENKIKKNLRFEKGIKNIKTDLQSKTVTITYDADKTDESAIIEAFKKINYIATECEVAPKENTSDSKKR